MTVIDVFSRLRYRLKDIYSTVIRLSLIKAEYTRTNNFFHVVL